MPRASAANLTLLATRTGVRRWVVVPSPSSPSLFDPQQYAAPAAVTPQLWAALRPTAAKLRPPAASTGVKCLVVVPSPTSPTPLKPQQYMTPASVTPQLWVLPAPTVAKRTSLDRSLVLPSPSLPA